MIRSFCERVLGWTVDVLVFSSILGLLSTVAFGQVPIKTYFVNQIFGTPPVADGVISPGEWDAANIATGYAAINGTAAPPDPSSADPYNNSFRLLYDDAGLYFLHQAEAMPDWLSNLGGNPDVVFGESNLNIYVDPNRDGDLNTNNAGDPILPEAGSNENVDGYQLAWNQYEGTTISTNADRAGIGVFTEAHVDSAFGDQAMWNTGGGATAGGGMGTIQIGMTNDSGASGGFDGTTVSEVFWPWADFDAEAEIDDGAGGLKPSGLNAVDGPPFGEVWGFDAPQWDRGNGGDNRIRWQWQNGGSFVTWPMGIITFNGHGHGPGDMNGDGIVNFGDLTPFSLGLTDIPAYDAAFPDLAATRVERGDVDLDTFFNFGDLTPFVNLLTGGRGNVVVPEPSGVSLVMLAMLSLTFLSSRRFRSA